MDQQKTNQQDVQLIDAIITMDMDFSKISEAAQLTSDEIAFFKKNVERIVQKDWENTCNQFNKAIEDSLERIMEVRQIVENIRIERIVAFCNGKLK